LTTLESVHSRFAQIDSPFLAKIHRWEPRTESSGPVAWMADSGSESLGSYLTRQTVNPDTTSIERGCDAVDGDREAFGSVRRCSRMKSGSRLWTVLRFFEAVDHSFRFGIHCSSHGLRFGFAGQVSADEPSSDWCARLHFVSPESDQGAFAFSNAKTLSDCHQVEIFSLGVAICTKF
jgi:hypothetical protein